MCLVPQGFCCARKGERFFTRATSISTTRRSRKAAVFPQDKIDILIMETTRGDHAMPAGWTRESEERRFGEAIAEAFERGGCVLVPVFALGKTQEVLAMLYKFRRDKLLPDFPIYIGGLSSKITQIYDRRAHMSRRQLPRLQLMQDVDPFILNGETIRDAPARPGRVYALSSGMMTPKTLSNIFARRVIENPRHSIFFVGYADPAIAGRNFAQGETGRRGLARSGRAGAARALQSEAISIQRARLARIAH